MAGSESKDAFVEELDALVAEKRKKGFCCAQVVLSIGMERLGIRDDTLLRASAGLCGGSGGGVCGALAGADMLFAMCVCPDRPARAARDAQKASIGALNETFAAYMGGTTCEAISKNDPERKKSFCPSVMAGAVEILRSVLRERGIDPDKHIKFGKL